MVQSLFLAELVGRSRVARFGRLRWPESAVVGCVTEVEDTACLSDGHGVSDVTDSVHFELPALLSRECSKSRSESFF